MQVCLEERLLVQCSRVALSDQAVVQARETLARKIDWEYVLEASIRHGTAPLLHHGLETVLRSEQVGHPPPQLIRDDLHRLYIGNRRRNRRLYKAIGQIAGTLHDRGVEALGLKDLQLAWEVYPDIGLRTMGDIDLLIHRSDYALVACCLERLGFRALPSADIPFTLKYAWAHHFHRPEDNLWIDLQWNVVQREWDIYREGNFDFDIDRMWRRARTLRINGSPLLVPSPEDMLFHLCLHLEGHQYSELVLFSDIDAFVAFYGQRFEWQDFTEVAHRYRAESSVYYVLLFTKLLFGTDIPEKWLCELAPRYFDASLFQPLFENLTSLHLSLDDIRLATAAPESLLQQWETIVRRQAVAAMQTYRELDQIAREFTQRSAPIAFLGKPSEKIFPDPALQSFREIYAVILDKDLPRLENLLRKRGFASSEAGTSRKRVVFSPRDPALKDEPIALRFEAYLGCDLQAILRADEPPGKKQIALTCLKRKLAGAPPDSTISITVQFFGVSREQALVALATQIARQNTTRLFAMCNLLEFLGKEGEFPKLDEAERFARSHNLLCEYRAGLAALLDLTGDGRFVRSHPADQTLAPVRMFEWARYGPEALDRLPGLKRAFYYAFTLLSLNGIGEKWAYISRSSKRDDKNQRILANVLRECVGTCWSLLSSKRADMKNFAYWLDTDGLGAKPFDRHTT